MDKPVIIFVCEHGAAKSILAATYFNHLANLRRVDLSAVARATHPDPELSKQTVEGLSRDGLKPAELVPQNLLLDDLRFAERIVSFCELPDEFREKVIVEQWEGIPAVSEDYEKARDAILDRLDQFLATISKVSP